MDPLEMVEKLEASMPADRHERRFDLSNGAIVRVIRDRVPGDYCGGCSVDVARYEHNPRCAVLAVETETARRQEREQKR